MRRPLRGPTETSTHSGALAPSHRLPTALNTTEGLPAFTDQSRTPPPRGPSGMFFTYDSCATHRNTPTRTDDTGFTRRRLVTGWEAHTHVLGFTEDLPQVCSKPEHMRHSEFIPIARYILFRAYHQYHPSATLIKTTASSELTSKICIMSPCVMRKL